MAPAPFLFNFIHRIGRRLDPADISVEEFVRALSKRKRREKSEAAETNENKTNENKTNQNKPDADKADEDKAEIVGTPEKATNRDGTENGKVSKFAGPNPAIPNKQNIASDVLSKDDVFSKTDFSRQPIEGQTAKSTHIRKPEQPLLATTAQQLKPESRQESSIQKKSFDRTSRDKAADGPPHKKRRYKRYEQTKTRLVINPSSESDSDSTISRVERFPHKSSDYVEVEQLILDDLDYEGHQIAQQLFVPESPEPKPTERPKFRTLLLARQNSSPYQEIVSQSTPRQDSTGMLPSRLRRGDSPPVPTSKSRESASTGFANLHSSQNSSLQHGQNLSSVPRPPHIQPAQASHTSLKKESPQQHRISRWIENEHVRNTSTVSDQYHTPKKYASLPHVNSSERKRKIQLIPFDNKKDINNQLRERFRKAGRRFDGFGVDQDLDLSF